MSIIILTLSILLAMYSIRRIAVYNLHRQSLNTEYTEFVAYRDHFIRYTESVAIDSDGQLSFMPVVDDTRTYIQIGDQLVDLFELDAWQAGKDIPVTVYNLD